MQTAIVRRNFIGSIVAALAAPFAPIVRAVAGPPRKPSTPAPPPWDGQDPWEFIKQLVDELGGPLPAIEALTADVVCHLEFVFDRRAEGKTDAQIDAIHAEFDRREQELEELGQWAHSQGRAEQDRS